MKIKLSPREKIITFTSMLVLLYYLFDFFIYGPKVKENAILKAEIASLDQKLQETSALLTSSAQVAVDVSRLEKQLSLYEEKFSTRESFVQFLEQLALQCQKFNMEIISLKPQEEQTLPADATHTQYQQVVIDMQLRSDFRTLVLFMQGLEKLPVFTVVNQLEIRRDEKTPGVNSHLILKTLLS
jgi:hypothetical protein